MFHLIGGACEGENKNFAKKHSSFFDNLSLAKALNWCFMLQFHYLTLELGNKQLPKLAEEKKE